MALLTRYRQRPWLRRFPWTLMRIGWAGDGRAIGTLSVWVAWERLTTWRWKVHPIRPGGVLCYQLTTYRGAPVTLRDGVVIRGGDPIIDIHFENDNIAQMIDADRSIPWRMMRAMAADLAALRRMLLTGKLGDVRALHAISLFADGGQRFGFEYHELPHTKYWALVRYFMVGLLVVHHPEGWARVEQLRETIWPGEIWLSVAALAGQAEDQPE